MDLRRTICNELRIPCHCVHITHEGNNNNKALCLVHENWVLRLLSSRSLPADFPGNESINSVECELMLRQRRHVQRPWRIVGIRAIEKSDRLVPALRRCQKGLSDPKVEQDLSYSHLLHYISETNYKNMWKDAYRRYCFAAYDKKSERPEKLERYTEVIRSALQRLYNCPFVTVTRCDSVNVSLPRIECTSDNNDFNGCHPNVLPAQCVLETSANFYILHPFLEHSVFDSLTFSPSVLGHSTSKPLFIIYQLLNAVRDLHDRGLCLGDIGFTDVRIDRNLWVYVQPNFLQNWTSNETKCYMDSQAKILRPDHLASSPSMNDSLCELTTAWVQGALSNYDYIMDLNRLSGRESGNPNHHPVLPWIMDFTVPNGGWRDLTKSKFRLNKGDRQLDLTYESGGHLSIRSISSHDDIAMAHHVPHHVSDVLSEITYFVYKARRTPRSVLCRCVRSNWVPAEYPSNVQRLYEWTPDECIPEFFTDPQIFASIHTDLGDLEVPWWSNSPEDFISKHRAALEGNHVSERLHHWIDLTFGYKLSGAAAVKAKNVCLHLVDQHKSLTLGGVVQLFNQPHPHRLGNSPYLGPRPPRIHYQHHSSSANMSRKRALSERSVEAIDIRQQHQQQQTRDQATSETEADCFSKFLEKRKTSVRSRLSPISSDGYTHVDHESKISLPKDYNPFLMLNQLEALFQFTTKTTHCMPDKRPANEPYRFCGFHHRRTRDMVTIGCLLVEIFLAPKLRALGSESTLEQRYKLVRSLACSDFYELPRCTRQAVQLLLQLNSDSLEIPLKMPTVTDTGLPPPSAHQFLQPLIQIIPFPSYFSATYAFLCRLKRFNDKVNEAMEFSTNKVVKMEKLAEMTVTMTSAVLSNLLDQMDVEGLDLLVPHLRGMFENEMTSVLSAWHLFNTIGQALGPQMTTKEFVIPLTRLFDPDCPTPKHLKLFHRSYLLQLCIRLGLQAFLTHFTTLLVEAVGGFKDFSEPCESLDGGECRDSVAAATECPRKSSGARLRSPELLEELVVQLNETEINDVNRDNVTLSPYDNGSSTSRTEVASPWSRSDAVVGAVATNFDTEPEIFTFEAAEDEFCAERIDVVVEKVSDQFDDSDSTSGDALSMGDMNLDGGPSPINEIDVCDEPPNCPSSYSEGFATKSIPKSDSFSCSVPNIPSAFLDESSSGIADDDGGTRRRSLRSSSTHMVRSDRQQKSSRNSACANDYNISDVATESIRWLSHRLGPVLTAKYLSRNLLRMMSLCYLGEEQLMPQPHESSNFDPSDLAIKISPWQVVGDNNSLKVSECLTSIASLYGEQFVMLQYLPHVIEIISQANKRITTGCEAGLVGCMVLVCNVIPYLSSKTLMDHLQDTIIKEIAYPVVRLVSSIRLNFPGGGHARQVIAYKLLDALHLIGLRIGFEMTRKHLTLTLQRFFIIFSRVHNHQPCDGVSPSHSAVMSPTFDDKDEDNYRDIAREELAQAFTPELAYKSYIPFCKLAGGIHMERNLPNEELLHQLCQRYDQDISISIIASKNDPDLPLEQATPNVNLSVDCVMFDQSKPHLAGNSVSSMRIGNRIGVHLEEEEFVPAGAIPLVTSPPGGDPSVKIAEYPKCDITKLISRQMENDQRHLRGNWFAYWEHEIGRSEKDNRFNFKQIKLLTYVGHVSNVRAIHVLDNENSFVSASKDKTVKLWSLRSHGNGSDAHVPCRYTYAQHRKSVFSVTFLESLRLLASCDSTVHVWDPFMGSCLKQFDPTRNSPVTVLTAMPAPSRVVLAATTEATVRFMDVRTLQFMHDYKVSLGSAGLIRCLAVSANGHWIAVGHSTGIISVLDVRTGLLSHTFKAHEGEILQVKAFNNDAFVTSSLDQCVSVWSADDGKLKCHLRGPTEPVHCLGFYKNEMISGTTASRIGMHTSIDSQASFSSTRLRSDTFKGVLTCLTVLPLNRLILLGADNGTIRLLC